LNIIRKHWKISAVIAVVLAAALIICIAPVKLDRAKVTLPAGKASETAELKLSSSNLAPKDMQLAVTDRNLSLFINKQTGAFSVYDANADVYWNSNPTAEQIASSGAMGTVKNEMNSQLVLTYYDANGLQQFFNTFTHSAEGGNLEFSSIKNGVSVTYTIGENEILISMLPAAIEKEKFAEEILDGLSEEDKETVLKYYDLRQISKLTEEQQKKYQENFPKADKDAEYYFLNLFAPDYALPKIYDVIFNKTDYSSDDMAEDNKKVGYEGETETLMQIKITVEYTLENGSFKVRIPADDISVSGDIYLTNIELLPFFAAADTSDNGYIIVPDGSGGIINLNNGRTRTPDLEIPVYGKDGSLSVNEKNVSESSAKLPIFAMVKNNAAFLSVIEQGDAISTLTARVSGAKTNINQIYPSFCILPKDAMVIKTSKESMATNLYQNDYYAGDIVLNFTFFGEDLANYSALANSYRSYLIEKGILTEKDTNKSMYVSLTGKIETVKSFFGINYNSYDTVTSFKDAQIIAEKLKKLGVSNLNFAFRSWYGGGLAADIPSNVSPASDIGGKKALESLCKTLGDSSSLALGADVVKIWQGVPYFNSIKYANRFLTNKAVKGYSYNIATNLEDKKAHSYFVLNAEFINSLIGKYTSSVEKMGGYSIWLDDVGYELGSDFRRNDQLSRTEAMMLISDALAAVPKEKQLILTSPNLYAIQFVDTALSMPTTSLNNYIINESIPFLQIVLSGCVDYTVPSVNGTGSAEDNVLKAVETGSMLYFDWIFAPDDEVAKMKGKEPAAQFSKNYENWIELAGKSFTEQKNKLEKISSGAIVSHSKIAENVYRTDWENGSVIVNYSSEDVTINGITVEAKNFAVCD